MYAYYPYQFEYQPQMHLRTDYPPHQSYPYSPYQDLNNQHETQVQQIQGQEPGQYSSQSGLHQQQYYQPQPVSTPTTSIDTPTPGFLTCPTTSASTGAPSSMSYYNPSTQPHEMVFTNPLVRPQQSPSSPDLSPGGPDAIGMEGYSYEYDGYEWTGEQQQQQQPSSLPPSSTYPSPSPSHQPFSSARSSPQPHESFESQPQSQSQSHIPPPRLTRPVRREREQPFRAFHPYSNNTRPPPTGAGEKEKRIETGGIIVEGDVLPSGSGSAPPNSRPAIILTSSSTLAPPIAPAPAQKAEPQPQSQPQHQRQRQSRPQLQPLPQTQTQTQPQLQPLPQNQTQPQPQPQPQPQTSPQRQSQSQLQPEPQLQSEPPQHRPQKPTPTIVTASLNSKSSSSKTLSQKASTSATSSSTLCSSSSPAVAQQISTSSRLSHSITRTISPPPISSPPTIIGLFGSYPLSRSQALPGPTCAPETSSSVMRLVLTPGALAHGGNGGKKDKSDKVSMSSAAHNPNMVMSVNMAMTPTAFNFSPNSSVPGPSTSSDGNTTNTTINGTHNTFNNAPTLGLSAAPSSSQSTMAIRKPRMACYFCRKRKIACGPGPVAIALAKQVQVQQAQFQQQQQQHRAAQSEQESFEDATTMEDSSKVKSPFEGDGSLSSPTSPLTPSSPPSISTSPTMSTLTPAQLFSYPQALTGDEGPCNQCARRGLACDRPTESKRGVRKGKSKKEKEKEARERETKELSPSTKKGANLAIAGEKKEERGHGKIDEDDDDEDEDDGDGKDRVGDDEGESGYVNEEEDLDVYMDGGGGGGEADGYENRGGGGEDLLKVENEDLHLPSTVETAFAPIDAQPQVQPPPVTATPEQNVKSPHRAQKQPSGRGRGRPPKHPKVLPASTPSSTPTSITAPNLGSHRQSGSTSGVKRVANNLKWTTPGAVGKKNKTSGKLKGKNEKEMMGVDDVPVNGMDSVLAESTEPVRETQAGKVLGEIESAADNEDGMDEDFENGNDEDGENQIDAPDDRRLSMVMPHPSDPVQTEEQVGSSRFQSIPAMYVSTSATSLSQSVVNIQPPTSSIAPYADAHSYTSTTSSSTPPPFSGIVAQPDSHPYYPQSHSHTPIVESPHQEQQHYPGDEMTVSSPVANTVYNGVYQNNNHNDADVHVPHEAMYSMEYVTAPAQQQQEQQHQSSMPVSVPQPEHVDMSMQSYSGFDVHTGTDLYSMNGGEVGSYNMATASWSIPEEGYDVQMNNGYTYDVDGQAMVQTHDYAVSYEPYEYGYAYTGQYAV